MGLHPIALRARSLRAVLLVQQVEGTESKSLHSTYCTVGMHAALGRGARFHHFRSEGTVPGSFKAVDKAVRLIVKFWLMPHMRRRRPPTAKRETKSQEPRSNVVSNDRTYPSPLSCIERNTYVTHSM